jgi:uncharacterized protein
MSKAISQSKLPYLGFGVGLRTEHYETIINEWPEVDWFEVLSENYMVRGGKPLHYLDCSRARYPVVVYGVSLFIGGTDPLDRDYLKQLKSLADRIEPTWISGHLCWTGLHGKNLHDLLPLPYTEEAIAHVSARIEQVQDALGRQIVLENVSSYVTYMQSTISEREFLTAIAEKADCFILLDINNIYVSAFNHKFDPLDYVRGVPPDRVCQFHVAGHTNNSNILIDTHDLPIIDSVWTLYAQAVRHFGFVSIMIERDDNMPPLCELLAELHRARQIAQPILAEIAA